MLTHCAIALVLSPVQADFPFNRAEAARRARAPAIEAETVETAELRILARWGSTGEPVRGAEVWARVRELELPSTKHPNDVPVSDSSGRMTLFVPAGYRYRVAARSQYRFGTHPITDVEVPQPGVYDVVLEFTEVEAPKIEAQSVRSFGASLAGVGDTNGDGVAEVFIGAPGDRVDCDKAWTVDPQQGSAWLVSCRDRSLRYGLRGDCPGDRFATAMAALWDWNEDGVRDCAIGAPGHDSSVGYVRVVSSAEGSALDTLRSNAIGDGFGSSLACAVDERVLAVGAPTGAPAAVYVFRVGASTATTVLSGPRVGSGFGAAVALLDLDGDGVLDVVVGAPRADGPSANDCGSVTVFSGADAQPLATLYGSFAGQRFGAAVAAVTDVDGDDFPDFAVGAPTDRSRSNESSVFAYSGRTRELISANGRPPSVQFGFALGPCRDVDGDGRSELLVGAPGGQNGMSGEGWAGWLSLEPGAGLSGTSCSYSGEIYKSYFSGSSFAAVGDINGDGIEEVAIGAPGFIYPGLVYFDSDQGPSHPVLPITPERSWRALGESADGPGAVWAADER